MERAMTNVRELAKLRIVQLLAALLVMSIIVYMLISPSTSGLKAPIQDQLHAMQVEDLVSAYAFTSQAFQKSTSLDSFKRFVRDYSELRNNDSILFNSSSAKNGIGVVKATLIARGGNATSVTYQLIKEHNVWKIESIIIVPTGEDRPADTIDAAKTPAASALTSAPVVPVTGTPAPTEEAAPGTPVMAEADNVYEDRTNNYSLHYPAGWEYAKSDDGMLVFHKTDSNIDNQTMLSIIPLTPEDSARISVQMLVDKGGEAIKAKAGSFKVVEDGLLPPGANKNENFHGRYIVYSYTLDNDKTLKQLQVIYFKSPSHAKFVIDYISPEAEFDADLPAVRAMIASFTTSE